MSKSNTQSPVMSLPTHSQSNHLLNLSTDTRAALCEVFATAAHAHKQEYLGRKRVLREHEAQEDHDKKHTDVLISLCAFSERYLKELAKTFKAVTGSEYWMEEVQKIIQQANQIA
ncbi:hypothetical protein [Psychrobacter urativorans]|uniref:Uncharacterized protein n=1 Tax=Psychrobacter urativorans TaxID=45610 RepID=A0A0M4TW25_9GAMM|nr:hypothetical protein [Psychrobacter urativorans]ALF60299.1 hypothetical protein AOC03_09840 [Psychrobacter urativorans]